MTEMGGDELCVAIKSDIETSHIPVILLTALSDEKNMLKGLDKGADAYITKPFSAQGEHQEHTAHPDIAPKNICRTKIWYRPVT